MFFSKLMIFVFCHSYNNFRIKEIFISIIKRLITGLLVYFQTQAKIRIIIAKRGCSFPCEQNG